MNIENSYTGDNYSSNRSGIFAPLYDCPNCGDVWRVHQIEATDVANDDVYCVHVCSKCGDECYPKMADGQRVLYELTDDEFSSEFMGEDE